ncbi:probable LRR receptor-like serine/threonine-protein kinase At3g47570 [Juglans microcarpa x Juglans regia]|uniref:probable LRR receptor-like serine/threonine-protein kinase At3g47570 n=1 Tax=Juglans microcarpa x Juglans regia TaxID=2249226 RepID=UPI001B7DB0F4|nr:probable LRR receptor-like serine/threonine-protein kinase At3g47570 [Juglans microcarpa x Juglans regia]
MLVHIYMSLQSKLSRMKKKSHSSLMFLMTLFLICQIILCYNMNMVRAQLDATTDKQALLSFKSLVSDPQSALNQWKLDSSHCNWPGVNCTNNGARVRSLVLNGHGLIGIIPPQLSNLTSLQILDLSGNSFFGHIPSELSRLASLQILVLAVNSINGTIPPALGNLPRLKILDLSRNNLSGAIPTTFGFLPNLTRLLIAENHISGKIPTELGRLRNLLELQLSTNQLTGEIPFSICNMSSLVFLSLTGNMLTGKLPSNIGHDLPRLTQLYLANNKLEGPIPSSLSTASQMQVIDLSTNRFSGSLPLLGNLKNLIKLNLGNNRLSSTTELNFQAFGSLTNCTKMEQLILELNQLGGELPISVSNLSANLQEFCIGENFFTGGFPQGFDKYQNLFALAINKNFFKGEIPSSIGQLKQLQRLMVHRNELYGEIPDIFGNLTRLDLLAMSNNQLSGGFPSSLAYCERLSKLYLAGNKLTGSITNHISGLSSLSRLQLAHNLFTGSLPMEIGNLKQLEVLDVSENLLSGNITTEITKCSSLRNLSMARNNLTGSIPSLLGELASLEGLDLSSNKLTGPVPKELENLEVLKTLNLSFNQLEGQIPRNGVFVNLTWDSLQGNYKLCGFNQEAAEKLRVKICTSNSHLLPKILIPVSCFIVLVCAICCFFWVLITQTNKNRGNKKRSSSAIIRSLPRLSYSEIQRATNGFAAENLIGKGGFGTVYKAVFENTRKLGVNTISAVKVLDLGQSKASKSFDAECEALRNIRHRNLVKVFTSCSSIDHTGADFKALIMEFMSNGNLDICLYPRDIESGLFLTLSQRLNIAIDVASALDYLHHHCEPPVVHCDLKPGNVLLDENMAAHVGDFGLARFLLQNPQQNDISTIGLKGSIGYIAPEYGQAVKASTSGDVYSFGILLLEMFIAKKPTDEMFKEGLNLNTYASTIQEKKITDIADPRLFKDNENYTQSSNTSTNNFTGSESSISIDNNSRHDLFNRSEECAAAAIRLGLSCATHSAKERLTMAEALTKLQELMKILVG